MHCSANVGDDGRRRDLLRALGHGQDDALGRPGAAPDRRRRARLGRRGRLQLRGRLLREGDPPLAEAEPRDLRDDAHVRHGARERRHRRARRPRPRRRLEDREHARRLQARADRERAAREARRPPAQRRLPDRGRLRDPAADRAPDPRAGDVLLPLRLHGEAGRDRDRRRPSRSRRFSACFGAPFLPQRPGRLRGDARREARRARRERSGSSTPAGRAGRSARASGCRSQATRALLDAALSGALDGVEYREDPVFGFEVPVDGAGRRLEPLLDPRSTWEDPERVRREGRELARMFRENFEKFDDATGVRRSAAAWSTRDRASRHEAQARSWYSVHR